MKAINIAKTADSPSIILDKANGLFEISGRSMPLNAQKFYQPVLDWLDKYSKNPNPVTTFWFNLEYFNTGSSKLILDIFDRLEEMKDRTEVNIRGFRDEDDQEMELTEA
ncbi:MAG: DUF1987 domain-containing protein [Bacteroidetes bacterium]|nr:MAG: DUF1987 domain-containing protein [Bacteroidota bacterium]